MLDNLNIQCKIQTKISILEKIFLFIWALFSVFAINEYFFGSVAILYKNSILNMFLLIPIVLLMYKSYVISDKSLSKNSVIGAIVVSLMLICGSSIYSTNDLSPVFGSFQAFCHSITMFIGFFIFFYFAIKFVLYYIRSLYIQSPALNEWKFFGRNGYSLFIIWGLIFLCWLPCYLSYFPGIYSYDIVGQTFQALGLSAFDRFQNTAHTFFFKICIDFGRLFGGAKAGLITYSIVQMLIMSFVFSFTIWYMAKIKIHFEIRMLALIYFALNPLNAIFSFVPTKDVLFTAFFILTTLMFIDISRNIEGFFHSYLRQLALCVLLILCCLFRTNAICAFFLFFIFFILMYKEYYKKILCIFTIFFISFIIITGPFYTALGVKGGDIKEALSVPMQQVANVVVKHDSELTQSDRDTIAEVINYNMVKKNYNPRFADPVKNDFNTNKFIDNPSKYANLWLSLFARYPSDYIDSFLSLNLGYWYPDCIQPDKYSNRMYIETYVWEDVKEFKIERKSKFPKLLEDYEAFASGTSMQKIPVLSLFFSIGFPIWFILICLTILIAKRKTKLILVLMPAFFLWVTFMAGPVSNLRYIYYIMACYPIYLAVVFQSDLFVENKKQIELHEAVLNSEKSDKDPKEE